MIRVEKIGRRGTLSNRDGHEAREYYFSRCPAGSPSGGRWHRLTPSRSVCVFRTSPWAKDCPLLELEVISFVKIYFLHNALGLTIVSCSFCAYLHAQILHKRVKYLKINNSNRNSKQKYTHVQSQVANMRVNIPLLSLPSPLRFHHSLALLLAKQFVSEERNQNLTKGLCVSPKASNAIRRAAPIACDLETGTAHSSGSR